MQPSSLILVGEDDLDDQEMIEEMILAIDPSFQMKFFNTGQKLLAYMSELDNSDLPSLILLDYNMPELNGVEILERMQGVPRYLPIPKLMWSTSNYAVLKSQCLRNGGEDFIVKPSSLSELDKTIRYILSFARNASVSG